MGSDLFVGCCAYPAPQMMDVAGHAAGYCDQPCVSAFGIGPRGVRVHVSLQSTNIEA